MFRDLANIVAACISSFATLKGLREKAQAEEAVVNLLTIYLVMTDVLHDGERLLALAGSDPLQTLRSAPSSRVAELQESYEQGIAVQGHRLYWLAGQLREDNLLKYFDRDTKNRLDEIIGNKCDRVTTLAGVVAPLVITTMFAGVETDDEAASLVQSMYTDASGNPLSVEAANGELQQLRDQLDTLRSICNRFVSDADFPRLLLKAKKKLK